MKFLINFLSKLMQTHPWRWLLRRVIGVFKFRLIGYPTYPMSMYFVIRKILQENPNKLYAFVSKDNRSLSYLFNKLFTGAKYAHAGFLMITNEGEIGIIHMLGKGLALDLLVDHLREVDEFRLIDLGLNEKETEVAFKRLNMLLDIQDKVNYDYGFTISNNVKYYLEGKVSLDQVGEINIYCSELIWLVCQQNHNKFVLNKIQGKEVFEPDDVEKIGKIVL